MNWEPYVNAILLRSLKAGDYNVCFLEAGIPIPPKEKLVDRFRVQAEVLKIYERVDVKGVFLLRDAVNRATHGQKVDFEHLLD